MICTGAKTIHLSAENKVFTLRAHCAPLDDHFEARKTVLPEVGEVVAAMLISGSSRGIQIRVSY